MATMRALRTVLLTAVVALLGACATHSASTTAARDAVDEKYFQREAHNYLKFQHEGQVVYCQNEPDVRSLIPHRWCITEAALRTRVENFRRNRNAVAYTKW